MSNALSALFASIVRTVVPIVVGAVLAFAVAHNIPLDKEFESLLSVALTAGFTTVYYIAVRLLETYVAPRLGWLLGLAKAPSNYSAVPTGADVTPSSTVNIIGSLSDADVAAVLARARRLEDDPRHSA
jgi:hypothetical protein